MQMKQLKRLKDCSSLDEVKKVAKKWLAYLDAQDGIKTHEYDKFDFLNQLDDFQNDEWNYYEVKQFIKWFFS